MSGGMMKKTYLDGSLDGETWFTLWQGYGDPPYLELGWATLAMKCYRVRTEEESAIEPIQTEEEAKKRDRDSHFAGFAELLWSELHDHISEQVFLGESPHEYLMQKIIAERAYDLVCHALVELDPAILDMLDPSEWVGRIPDLTEWPESEEQS